MEARGINRRLDFELTTELVERFNQKIVRSEDCWSWKGCLRSGYGAIRYAGHLLSAHVLSYRIHCGDIPEGHVIRHSCHNRECTNPKHLSTGTPADNAADTAKAGRVFILRGEASPTAVLTNDLVRLIHAIRMIHGFGAVRIARLTGQTKDNVETVIYKHHWRHIPTPTPTEAKQIIAEYEASQC